MPGNREDSRVTNLPDGTNHQYHFFSFLVTINVNVLVTDGTIVFSTSTTTMFFMSSLKPPPM